MGCAKSKNLSANETLLESDALPKGASGMAAAGDVKLDAKASTTVDEHDKNDIKYFNQRYKMDKELGRGNYSVVRRGVDTTTNQILAIKCITEKSLSEEDKVALKIETALLKELNHPNIIKFLGFYQDDKMYYILTEFVGGGELFDRIVAKEYYSEADAQKVVLTVANALKYCHSKNVVHRDLKPENILLTSNQDDGNIKIADFGFAKQFSETDKGLTTSCGTPGYVAPEILNGKKYGKEVDMWSLGVIIYILLCGYPPFHEEDQRKLFKQIRAAKYEFDPDYWSEVSDSAKDLIRSLLLVDGSKRLTVEQLLEHQWLSGAAANTVLKPAQEKLRNYQARKRWKTGFTAITAANRLASLTTPSSQSSGANTAKSTSEEKATETNGVKSEEAAPLTSS